MTRLIALVFLLLFLATTVNYAQQFTPVHYNEHKGFPVPTVQKVIQDNQGNIWAGTFGNGLYKYDSEEFTQFTTADGLKNNIINCLAAAHNKVYIATKKGLSVYNGNKIENITLDSANSFAAVSMLEVGPTGDVWVAGSFPNIRLITKDEIKVLEWNKKEKGIVKRMYPGNDGGMYILTHYQKLYYFKNGEAQLLKQFDNGVISFLQDSNNNIWVVDQKTFWHYSGKEWLIVESGDIHEAALTNPRDGSIYVAINMKLYNYSFKDGKIEKSELDIFGAEIFSVTDIFVDKDKNIWIGTYGNGLFKLSKTEFTSVNDPVLRQSIVMGMVKMKNNDLWYCSPTHGLLIHNKDGITNVTKDYGLPTTNVLSCAVDKNDRIWIGTGDKGLFRIQNGIAEQVELYEGSGYTIIKGADNEGRIWFANGKGIHMFDNESFTTFSGANTKGVYSLYHTSDGKILFGTSSGVSIFTGIGFDPYRPEIFSNKEVSAITEDIYGNLWFAIMGEGLLCLKKGKGDKRNTKETIFITQKEGLLSGVIFTLFAEGNNVWVGTSNGINKIVLSEDEIQQISSYRDDEGFFGKETNSNAYAQIDNKVYFGSLRGVFVYNPLDRNIPITAYLKSIVSLYDNLPIEKSDSVFIITEFPERIELHTNVFPVKLKFNAIDFAERQNLLFSWKMGDGNWSKPSVNDEYTLSGFEGGDHMIEVKAGTLESIDQAVPAKYKLSVIIPFYKDWKFHLLLTIGVILFVLLLIKLVSLYKVRKALKIESFLNMERESIRKDLALDFHDEIGNLIVSINTHANVLKVKLQNAPQDISSALDKIQDVSKTLFHNTKDFIWSMDRASDELFEIFIHVKDFGEQFFKYTSVTFNSQSLLDAEVNIPIREGSGRHISRIFKEVMTNVLKHSGATEVNFTLSYLKSNNSYVVEFKDNGHGLKQNENLGHGLKNISHRAELIGARVAFVSVGSGFGVRLFIESKADQQPVLRRNISL